MDICGYRLVREEFWYLANDRISIERVGDGWRVGYERGGGPIDPIASVLTEAGLMHETIDASLDDVIDIIVQATGCNRRRRMTDAIYNIRHVAASVGRNSKGQWEIDGLMSQDPNDRHLSADTLKAVETQWYPTRRAALEHLRSVDDGFVAVDSARQTTTRQ